MKASGCSAGLVVCWSPAEDSLVWGSPRFLPEARALLLGAEEVGMVSIIERELLKHQGVDLQSVDIPIEAGTFTFWIGDIDWANPDRVYCILSIHRDQWRISLVKNSSNELVYCHRSGDLVREIRADASQLARDKQHFFALIWTDSDIRLFIDQEKISAPVQERPVKPIVRRQLNASPEIAYAEIHIPDDTDLGTGRFTTVLNARALESQRHIASAMVNQPRFQISVTLNCDTRRIPVLLGRADGTPPASGRVFALPKTDPGAEHSLVAHFRDWEVTGLDLDDVMKLVALSDKAAIGLEALESSDKESIERLLERLAESPEDLVSDYQVRKLAVPGNLLAARVTDQVAVVINPRGGRFEVLDVLPSGRLETLATQDE